MMNQYTESTPSYCVSQGSQDQTTDSYIDQFLNFDDCNQQLKIEEHEDYFYKQNNWTPKNEQNQIIPEMGTPFNERKMDLIPNQNQFNNPTMQVQPKIQRRSMKIKKEIAKQNAKRNQMLKNEQLLQQQQIQQQNLNNDSDSTHEGTSNSQEEQVPTQPPMANLISLDAKPDKTQLQKIRNRISAQHSRDRKKVYVQNMESELIKIKQENDELQSRLGYVMKENERLKKELMEHKKIDEENDDLFKDPIINHHRRGGSNFGLGLVLLSLVALIAFFGTGQSNEQNKGNESNTLIEISKTACSGIEQQIQQEQQQQQESIELEKLEQSSPDHEALLMVDQKSSNTAKILHTPSTLINTMEDINNDIAIKQEEGFDTPSNFLEVAPVLAQRNSTNLRASINKQIPSTSLTHYTGSQEVGSINKSLLTYYCPKSYKLLSDCEINPEEGQVIEFFIKDTIPFTKNQYGEILTGKVDNNKQQDELRRITAQILHVESATLPLKMG